MTRETMMKRIQGRLNNGETVEVSVAHRGNWSGADIYMISSETIEYIAHRWRTSGNLRATYSRIVLNK